MCAEGSVQAVMDGRQYNRAVRVHKLVYEAILRLAWKEFLPWLEQSNPSDIPSFNEAMECIRNLSDDLTDTNMAAVADNKTVLPIRRRFEEFLDIQRSGANGEMAEFWMSYVDMVEILLGLLRASREGNWMLHLGAIRAMLPWVFAYDKINYARYLPVYYAQMTQLHTSHPAVYNHFMNGSFFRTAQFWKFIWKYSSRSGNRGNCQQGHTNRWWYKRIQSKTSSCKTVLPEC